MPEMGTSDRYYRNGNLDIVREAPGAAERFHPCEPHHDSSETVTGAIYVHAKMIIVDDLYVTIGSANFSPRSMTHDSEINVGVLGTDLIEYVVD
jgi:phosphatidylserine/phosphatidylglycerophosphate/cardiolipin synthase-like enzyme